MTQAFTVIIVAWLLWIGLKGAFKVGGCLIKVVMTIVALLALIVLLISAIT